MDAGGMALPAVFVCALLGAAAVFLVSPASAVWHPQVLVVGGEPRGWAKPTAPDDETYNHWADRNRFHVGDFLHFKYDSNDSVLVVSRDDYKVCGAARPALRFGGGDTRVRLDHTGFCYFISGAPGHCDAGQRMTVRVLPQPQEEGSTRPPAPAEAPAAAMAPGAGEDEGGTFGPPAGGSGSGGAGGGGGWSSSKPGQGGGGGSVTGPGSMPSSSTPPPRGVAGAGGNNNKTSSAAPARASPAFGGCCYRHVVGAVVLLGASLLVLPA